MANFLLWLIKYICKMNLHGLAARKQALLFLAGQGGQQLILDQNIVRG